MSALLSVDGLRVTYRARGGTVEAVRGVRLEVARREITAIVGESGSGKSSLAHAVMRLLPESARISGGAIRFDGLDLATLAERPMRAVRGSRIGFVPQDPMSSLNPVRRIGAQVAEPLLLHTDLSPAQVRARVVDLLEEVGLPDPGRVTASYPHQLSGGMRQRVLIAMALACSPDLVIADEPTSALDPTVAAQVLARLEQLVHEHDAALLMITHDLAAAARVATSVAVMQAGRVVEHGPADRVLGDPAAEYTRTLVADSLHLRPRAHVQARTGRVAESAEPRDPVAVVTDVRKSFRGEDGGTHLAVDGVSFALEPGRTLALVGESGSGKSTTARMLLGLERPDGGGVTVHGTDLGTADPRRLRELRRRMQVVYQSPFASLDPRFSVAEIVDEPLRSFREGDRRSRAAAVTSLLDRVGLPAGYARRRPRELSGGQRQRVAIARALALGPDIVVCDEPVSALDATVQARILDLLADIQQESGVAYLFISHDMAVVRDIAHRVAVLSRGRIVETGTVAEVYDRPRHDYTRALLAAGYPTTPLTTP